MRAVARVTTALVGVLAALLLAGCGGGGEATPASTTEANQRIDPFTEVAKVDAAAALVPQRIASTGTLTVVMNVSSAPTKFFADDNSTIVGLNPDLARALGRVLGLEVTIADVQFDGIIPGLTSGRYDVAIASMAPSAERVQALDMIRYGAWGTSLAVPAGNPAALRLDSLCGHAVAVQQGSVQHLTRLPELSTACTSGGRPAVQPVVLPDQTTALLQLSSGRVEAVLADTPVLAWAGQQRPGTIDLVDEMNRSGVAVATAKGSDLTPALEAGLTALMATPTYKQIYAKWGMDGAAVDRAVLETAG
ncbi:ABC transporter substrate-binding protein [Actinomycetes bacterium KLBMP 9759]